jgi:fatty-acyl-CoA synthase
MIEKTTSAYDYQLLIKHLLYAPVSYNSEQEIVYRDKVRITYKEFRKRINKLANVLTNLGLEKGKTVGVMDWDSHRYLEVYFAVPMMGAVMHMVNIRLPVEQILYTINHAEDEILLINKEFLPIYEAIKDKLTTVKKLILLTDDDSKDMPDNNFVGEYENLLKGADENYDFPDFDENTRATTFYTTGTTGSPKGVYFSHRQLVLHTLGVLSSMATAIHGRIGIDDVYMPLTPMFHVHAWGIPYLSTMLGIKQVYPGRYEPSLICKLIRDEKVTFSHCVPTVLQLILSDKEAESTDFSKMKIIIGGSALTEKLCRTALDKGIDIFTGYGMSETCPVITLAYLKPSMLNLPIEKQVEIRCKTGLPTPLTYINLMSLVEGTFLPNDGKSIGEIVVRCPWLTMGYYKEKERSEELWRGGWLHTGDLAYCDTEGYFKIVDRAKDVIKSGGEWISSLDIENIIVSHEAVAEAAVIGIPDEKWDERPMALIVLKENYKGKVTLDDIRKHFQKFVDNGTITKWAVPDIIEFVDSIPKTSVGKFDKKAMRKKYVEK